MGLADWIGYMAAIATTACYVPQALHIIRERRTAGISLMAYSLLLWGVGLWLIYGILVASWPIILANAASFILIFIIVVMKLRLG